MQVVALLYNICFMVTVVLFTFSGSCRDLSKYRIISLEYSD